jgi:hypothetical protein
MKILRAEEKKLRRSYGSDDASEDGEDGVDTISDTLLIPMSAMPGVTI